MPDVLNTGYRIADLGIATVGAVVSPMTALAENFSESIMRERLLSVSVQPPHIDLISA